MTRFSQTLRAARSLYLRATGSDIGPISKAFSSGSPASVSTAAPPEQNGLRNVLANVAPDRGRIAYGITGFTIAATVGAGGLLMYQGKLDQVPVSSWFSGSLPAHGGALAPGSPRRQEGWTPEQVQRVESPAAKSFVPGLGPHFIADAAAKAAPAVVNVTVKPPQGAIFPSSSSGSGFIMGANGTVVTNAHVISEALDQRAPPSHPTRGARPVIVALQDGRSFEGRVEALDRVSDIALVKIDCAEDLPAAELGTSAGLRTGEWILALGSPLHLHNTVTAGIVSCTERKAAELGLAPSAAEYIQMDVAINQGNSGGPVVNLWGQVVGISHTKVLTTSGISFAIPIDTAKHVIRQLEDRGRVQRPHVGMKLLELNAANIPQLRARDAAFPGVSAGILVPAVTPGSPADVAGLQAGDVIIGYAGGNEDRHRLTTSALVRALGEHVGQPMQLQVLRPSKPRLTLEVTPEEAP